VENGGETGSKASGTSGKRASTPFRWTTSTAGMRCSTWSETRCGPGSWPPAASGDGRAPRCIWGWRRASFWISCVGGLVSTQLVGNATFLRAQGTPRSRTGFAKRHCALASKTNPPHTRPERQQQQQRSPPRANKLLAVNELGGGSEVVPKCQRSLTPGPHDPVTSVTGTEPRASASGCN
jgi:hypothetical protein